MQCDDIQTFLNLFKQLLRRDKSRKWVLQLCEERQAIYVVEQKNCRIKAGTAGSVRAPE